MMNMQENIKVSAIVPVYNAKDYLGRFMTSLLNQSMPSEEMEIILVDDGSKDNSGELCDEFAKEHSFVKVIHQENAGPAAARNAGLEAAVGTYVAFIDPDDLIDEKYMEVAYAQAVHFGADIVLFDAYREKKNGDELIRENWGHAKYSFNTSDAAEIRSMQRQILYPYMAARVGDMIFDSSVPLAAPWDKLYSRRFLIDNDLKFPSELRVLDDMCFNFKAFGAAGKVSYIPTFLYHYMVEEKSITNSYRSDRVQQDVQVFEYLKNAINEMGLDMAEAARFRQALYARIIKSFAISLRLYFFNPKNTLTKAEVDKELRACIDSMPYKLAFKGIKLFGLEPKLMAVTIACRLKSPEMLRVLFGLQYR